MVWYIKIINVCITVFILLRIQSPINASLQWAPSLILISAVLKSAIGTPVRLTSWKDGFVRTTDYLRVGDFQNDRKISGGIFKTRTNIGNRDHAKAVWGSSGNTFDQIIKK